MDQLKDNIKKEESEKLLKDMTEKGQLSIAEDMIKDNKIPFELNGKQYRVRMLTLTEKGELDLLRRKKFGQLIQDTDILLEKALIGIYKERGINIEEIDEQIRKLDLEIHDAQLLLGESLSKNEGETILKTYTEKIQDRIIDKQVLFLHRSSLLEFSLENQLLNYVSEIITYLSTEVQMEVSTWVRLWKTLEDFHNCEDNDLINRAATTSMTLHYIF
jgi:hypothetical protein